MMMPHGRNAPVSCSRVPESPRIFPLLSTAMATFQYWSRSCVAERKCSRRSSCQATGRPSFIPAAAMKLGRPVAWQEDRREHFLSATQERDQYWKVAIAVDNKGKILGLSGTLLHDTGAFLPWGIIMPYISATTFPGPYVVPAYRVEATVVFTNRVPTTVVRGAGRPQAVFAMERLIDRIARELDIHRAALRRRNMIGAEQMRYSVRLGFCDGKPLAYASRGFPKS